MDKYSLLLKLAQIADEYIFSAFLLHDSLDNEGIDIKGHKNTRPLFHLIAHSCECLLKALCIEKNNCSEKQLKNYGHKLTDLHNELKEDISDELKELVFYLSSSHFNYDGVKSSHPLRYNDSHYDSNEEKKRRLALLDKQKQCGYSLDTPIYVGNATKEQKEILEPELSNYSKYLFSHTLMRPHADFAINTIREELSNLFERIGQGKLSLTRDEFVFNDEKISRLKGNA